MFIEPLESRQLLSVTLSSIGAQSLYAGAPLNIALNGESDNPLSYTVAVSNSNLTASDSTAAELTAVVSDDNPSIRIAIDDDTNDIHGNVTIQLFEDLAPETVDQILALVEDGFYDGLTFHRIIEDFMIQGGDPDGDGSGGPGFEFDDEYTAELQFTSAGLLAMANSGTDTNGSQFFITVAETRWLDFQHAIFGMVTEGMDIVEQLSLVETDSDDAPLGDVVMTSVTVVDDTEDAVLRLSVPDGVTGTANVTVTVTDTVTNETTSETFQVTAAADTTNNLPFLGKIDPIVTSVDTPVTITVPAADVEGDAIDYYAAVSPYDANLAVSIDDATGALTVVPSNGAYGVFSILVEVSNSAGDDWDMQYVPVYVNPTPPTALSLTSASDTGGSDADSLTNLNNSAGSELTFEIEGIAIGALVELYADGALIGQTTAAATTVTVVTDGAAALADGAHQFTVKQTIQDEEVAVGNLETTVDLVSGLSTSLAVTIDTAPPVISSTPVTTAYEEGTYIYQVAVADEEDGLVYSLEQSPTGMTIDADTGRITWTSITGEGTTEQVTVKVTDAAGNETEQTYDIEIAGSNTTPVLTPAAPVLGSTDENTALTIGLTGTFINNGDGMTVITDADETAYGGGIAVIGTTGNGVWAYSLDGTTFTDIGTVSAASALLLPAGASLRYTPDGENAETATISYAAWDGTTGHDGLSAVDTTSGGDHSAFSSASDAASVIVAAVNDAPVLTPASPSADSVASTGVATIAVDSFINNGEGTTAVVDPDDGDAVGGIAVVGFTGSGTWQYSLDGSAYIVIQTVSDTSSLLLPGSAYLRYTPDASAGETATVSYRAWDAASGTAGGIVDTTTNGGSTAFSAAADTLTLTVTAATGSISGYVYVDADNDGLRITPAGQSHLAMQGVVVRLLASDGQGNWTQVAAVSTGTDGSYRFDNLSPGTYRVQEVQPAGYLDGQDAIGTVNGVARGSRVSDRFQFQLAANENGVEYNFGERGILPTAISLRNCLASAPAATQNVTPAETDQTPPAGYSISADDAKISAAESASISFTFSGAEVGATYNYTIVSSGGTGTVAGSGTIATATQQVTGIDVSALSAGTLTFSAVLTDETGNAGAAVTAAAVLDETAPSGYSVVLNDSVLDETEAADAYFQINDGEIGATYNYTITSDGGTGSVSGSGTVSAVPQVVSGLDFSALADGTLTFSVTLTDAAGNAGTAVAATAALDRVTPSGYTITADDATISAADADDAGFTFAGAEVGATYNYVVTSAGGDGEVAGSGEVTSAAQQVTGIDVSGLPDGELTFSVTLTDIGGKTGDPATAAAKLDKTAPSGYSIVPDDDPIDDDTAADTGFWIFDGEPFATYSFTITSSGGDGTVSGSSTTTLYDYHVQDIDVSSLPDGLLTITLALTDEAGNAGDAVTETTTLERSSV